MTPDPLREELISALGPAYTLERELGGGGMSRVFVARDVQLDRDVVVKVLPPDTAAAVSAERFKREIMLAARLQHPHIVPLLGAGATAGGLPWYTMPFVAGESLRQRLAREGELPIGETVGILREVARALAYAHAQGVVHRDIKPDNVMLTGGSVMVTDFGVAKALAIAGRGVDGDGRSPISGSLTTHGMALGTPAYMAPEQAAAEPTVDQRADLYALGCMAYEMLSGAPPFAGRNASATIAAHMAEPPEPIERRRPNVPSALAALIMQCLEKRAADRPHSAEDFLRALDSVTSGSATLPTTPTRSEAQRRPASRTFVWLTAAVLAALAITGATWWALHDRAAPQSDSPVVRFDLPLPPGWTIQQPSNGASQVEFSPDGLRIIVRLTRGDSARLFERPLASDAWRPLPGTDGATGFGFSADGRWMLVQRWLDRRVDRIPVGGGPAENVLSTVSFSAGAMASDGSLYFPYRPTGGILRLPPRGTTTTAITQLDTARREFGHWAPQLVDQDRYLLFTSYTTPVSRAGIEAVTLGTGERRRVVDGCVLGRYAAGFLFCAKGDAVLAAPFDLDRLTPTRPLYPVLDSIGAALSAGFAPFAVSANGTLAYVPDDVVNPLTELVWVDRSGRVSAPFGGRAAYEAGRLSPDGSRLALTISDRGYATLSVLDLARNILTPISRREATTGSPVWSPDSRTLYYAVENPVYDIFRRAADASEPETQLLSSGSDKLPTSVTPDGRALLFADISFLSDSGGSYRIVRASLDTARSTDNVLSVDGAGDDAAVSPNGGWLLYTSTESGRPEVYLRSYPDGRRVRHQLSAAGAMSPRWTRAGREVIFAEGQRIMAAAVNAETGAPAAAVPLFVAPPGSRFFDVSADGSRFLFARRPASDEDAPATAGQRIVVVVNWLSTVRERLRQSGTR